ncbi:MAG: hypothetical protein Q7T55_03215, partial [Solirubrobacteraceae bacterium]|nr:hypothetical protein [Solirubrobacteraceae bacterium]
AAVVSVLLGRAVGWRALLAPLVPIVVWAVTFAVLIAFGTEPESDERGLSTLFAFLAIASLAIAGELCVLAGCLWRVASPPRPTAGEGVGG